MSESNWQSLMRAQQSELDKFAAMDAEMNEDQNDIDADIDNVLKKPFSFKYFSRGQEIYDKDNEIDQDQNECNEIHSRRSSLWARNYEEEGVDDDIPVTARSEPRQRIGAVRQVADDNNSPSGKSSPAKSISTENNSRFQKAKLKVLTKQVEEGQELRKQLLDQVKDLQNQLKIEREENKRIKKRIQTLELENRKAVTGGGKRSGTDPSSADGSAGAGANDSADSAQEIASLRKDLQTAERLVKQSEMNAKTKDTQLKRALESVSRLKSQVTELQQANAQSSAGGGNASDSRSRIETLEAKVKELTKQRTELMSAFEKQMKLIDVLKRQKVVVWSEEKSLQSCANTQESKKPKHRGKLPIISQKSRSSTTA